MLTLTRAVRVCACAVPVDMSKGFDGLSALVEQQLGGQLLKGDVFLFVGRCRRRAKVLYFDGTGLVLLTKRLFKGRFARPWVQEGAPSVALTVAELSLSLEGCELAGRWKPLQSFGASREVARPGTGLLASHPPHEPVNANRSRTVISPSRRRARASGRSTWST